MCKRGWRTKVSSVGDIAGNTRVLEVLWIADYISNSSQKLTENEYCSKLEKEFRFQFICTSNLSYFLELPIDDRI